MFDRQFIRRGVLPMILAIAVLSGTPAAAQIKIGIAEALTGNASQYGVAIRKSFELAGGEITSSGGINGQKLELVIEDEQGKKEEAINVFKKLIFQDKVLMLFGPTLSNSAQASDPVAQAARVVVFGTSTTADGITSIGNYAGVDHFSRRTKRPAGAGALHTTAMSWRTAGSFCQAQLENWSLIQKSLTRIWADKFGAKPILKTRL